MMRISVVITNYNYAAMAVEAIVSVRAQTRPADELIVVDDGSRDDSLALLQRACEGHPDTRLVAKANGGQLSALIAGTEAATGDVICYLDADDLYEPDYLATLVPHYEAGGVDFVYTNLRYFGTREGLWRPENSDHPEAHPEAEHPPLHDHGITVLETLYAGAWIGAPTSALSMRRRVAQQALDVPARLHGDWRTRADDVLIYGASLCGATKRRLGVPLVRYRVHDDNAWFGRSQNPAEKLQHDLAVRRLLGHYARSHGLDRDALLLAKQEFRSKPVPSRAEYRTALSLAWRAPGRLSGRLERMLSITRHYWRASRR